MYNTHTYRWSWLFDIFFLLFHTRLLFHPAIVHLHLHKCLHARIRTPTSPCPLQEPAGGPRALFLLRPSNNLPVIAGNDSENGAEIYYDVCCYLLLPLFAREVSLSLSLFLCLSATTKFRSCVYTFSSRVCVCHEVRISDRK